MTIKGLFKLIKHPRIFLQDYMKKKYFSKLEYGKEAILTQNIPIVKPIELSILDLKSLTFDELLSEVAKYTRIYTISEIDKNNKENIYEYGVDSEQLKFFLTILHYFSISGFFNVYISIKSKYYFLDKKSSTSIYNEIKRANSFFLYVENINGDKYKQLFYIADILDGFLVFRSNNVLYKKQKFTEDLKIENGFVKLRELNKHLYPSMFLWDEPVDIVYTWVNSEDEQWQKMILEYKTKDELDFDRYQNFDELKYSLRSIEQHAPWVRNIYIVTNCEKPSWLDTHSKIKWIWHEDIFPTDEDYLPTFSSHSIESCLHRIDGLSEHFIYFNDDVFLMKNVNKNKFFTTNGCSISFMEPYGTAFYPREVDNETYINAALNVKHILEKKFGFSPVQYHKHVPHSLKKSVLVKMEKEFYDNYYIVRKNKFRDTTDISTISFLYHHYSYYIKESIRGSCSEHLIRNTNYRAKARRIRSSRPDFICINDGGGSNEDKQYKEWMLKFLEKYYPNPAEWEKSVYKQD